MAEQSPSSDPLTAFGPNEWLVDELYEQYTRDKNSVDKAWWSFFEDYVPGEGQHGPRAHATNGSNGAPAAAAPQEKAAQPETPAPATSAPAPKEPAAAPAATQAAPAKQAPPADDKGAEDKTGGEKAAEPKASAPTPREPQAPKQSGPLEQSTHQPIRGAGARVVTNMEASLEVPTATSVRAVPAKLLVDNRIVINNHLARSRGGKVSFTHVIGYALVKALAVMPEMNNGFGHDEKGKPVLVTPAHVNLGLAIDLAKPDGTRQLLVPSIKAAETMDFAHFWTAYEDVVKKARGGKLTVEDFQGTSISLTNPGTIGTVHSVPRLMAGQGAIIGVGAMEYPAEWQGASAETLDRNAVSKILTLTSTYDHRIIQGAQSGDFLRIVHGLLLGDQGFYDEIFESLRIPYEPIRWVQDVSATHDEDINKVARVQELIHAYRVRGHLMADTDPLEYKQRRHPDLDITNHGLTLWDLDRQFATGGFGGQPFLKLRKILGILRDSYCRTVGVEYMHIQDPEQRRWIQAKIEVGYAKTTREEQLRILRRLNAAEAFETFLQTKFVGQKRFSLEGGESVIALMDRILSRAAEDELDEVCIGMPHRGRLNVLANIAGKSYGQIFREFEGRQDPRSVQGSGDVKYHLGTEGEFTAETGATTKVYLAANPSHLEAVNPVVEGIARAKMDASGTLDEATVLPVLLHGDASFSGQGVVYETLQMSQLRGYRTGGTIHIVVNNQVGFTTAPTESRSSVYCTDLAKAIQAPIFHVNGDDPEAVARVGRLAFQYRQRFQRDVVIDLVAYRRRGHNEGDDPSFTQPNMYDLIEQKRSVRRIYTEALIGRGDISDADAAAVAERFRSRLEGVFKEVKAEVAENDEYTRVPFYPAKLGKEQGTGITREVMARIAQAQVTYPEGFSVHPKVAPQMQRRADAILNGPIDWATGEMLAFGSLLLEGRTVRLSGQDSRRGTFSQRFAAVVDRVTNEEFVPLKHLSEDQGQFHVFDSLLSEYAAMGFEYGYSVASPQALVCWEAQFGDFANGAQTIADEFISSGAAKWTQKSGVVLLLPHGYEGQGPDHSSARIERWLALCSENALAVCQPSTAASHFHLLRTHTYVNWHRPVVIMTPKSMLRNKAAASDPDEFVNGRWRPAIGDESITDPSAVKTVLLCSGKIRWELVAQRAKRGLEGQVAIISLERLYPLPTAELAAELARYPHADVRYVQDEPLNQGAWWFMALQLPDAIAAALPGYELRMTPVARPAASSPSVGTMKAHSAQEAELMEQAFRQN